MIGPGAYLHRWTAPGKTFIQRTKKIKNPQEPRGTTCRLQNLCVGSSWVFALQCTTAGPYNVWEACYWPKGKTPHLAECQWALASMKSTWKRKGVKVQVQAEAKEEIGETHGREQGEEKGKEQTIKSHTWMTMRMRPSVNQHLSQCRITHHSARALCRRKGDVWGVPFTHPVGCSRLLSAVNETYCSKHEELEEEGCHFWYCWKGIGSARSSPVSRWRRFMVVTAARKSDRSRIGAFCPFFLMWNTNILDISDIPLWIGSRSGLPVPIYPFRCISARCSQFGVANHDVLGLSENDREFLHNYFWCLSSTRWRRYRTVSQLQFYRAEHHGVALSWLRCVGLREPPVAICWSFGWIRFQPRGVRRRNRSLLDSNKEGIENIALLELFRITRITLHCPFSRIIAFDSSRNGL